MKSDAARFLLAASAGLLAWQGCASVSRPQLLPGAPPITSVSVPPDVHLSGGVELVDSVDSMWRPYVRFTNDSKDTVIVEHGACSVAVWVYSVEAVSGPPIWDNRLPPNTECILIGYLRQIPPQGHYDLPAGLVNTNRSPGLLPNGNYKVVLAVQNDIRRDVPLVLLPAGQLFLKRSDKRRTITSAAADSLTLERTLCYGTCPAYRLRLSATGEARFESRNPGDEGRNAVDNMPARTLSHLIARAIQFGFFELPSEIAGDRVLCGDRATDHPTVTTTVFTQGATKTVIDYHGCFETNDHLVPPAIRQLRDFEDQIDSVLKSSRWVRPARRR